MDCEKIPESYISDKGLLSRIMISRNSTIRKQTAQFKTKQTDLNQHIIKYMAHEQKDRCLISSVIREMQIKLQWHTTRHLPE